VHESGESFCLKDAEDQILGYFYYEDEPGRRQQYEAPDPRSGAAHRGEHYEAA
jgi:hypothetical protein